MKHLDYFLVGLCLALLSACGQRSQQSVQKLMVKVDTVQASGRQLAVQYPGRVKAARDISLSFRVSGTIQRMYVQDGAYVRKGQLLAELDPTDYQVQLDAAEAEYQKIKAEAGRVMALYRDSVATPDANDKAVYGLKQITAKYNHAKDQLAYTRLYAPFDGYVQQAIFDIHETIAAGMPVLDMISEEMPEVEINLPAAEYIRRQQFARYSCTFDVYPQQSFILEPISFTPKANANQLYTMRLKLKKNEQQAVPSVGMNTMVTIEYAADAVRPLSIPSNAVRHEGNVSAIFLYNPSDQTVKRCEVTVTRLLGNGRCLVSGPDLKSGDLVVASGVYHIEDGEQVELLQPVSETNVGGLL